MKNFLKPTKFTLITALLLFIALLSLSFFLYWTIKVECVPQLGLLSDQKDLQPGQAISDLPCNYISYFMMKGNLDVILFADLLLSYLLASFLTQHAKKPKAQKKVLFTLSIVAILATLPMIYEIAF